MSEVVRLHDEALELMPKGARHDASLCPICIDRASQTTSETPPTDAGRSDDQTDPNLATEGGKQHMDTLTKETHEALMSQAVERATEQASARIAELEGQVSSLTEERDSAQAENANLTTENARLNGELDTAQVGLKAKEDEVSQLKTDIEERDEQARLAEIASTRAQQVRNLKLGFTEEQISEKASRWAQTTDEDWAERLEEWKTLRPEGSTAPTTDDTAGSAMSGSNEADDASSNGKPKSARRAVLGLD